MSNKILFFGNERLATGVATTAPALRALIAAGYEITGVILAQGELGQSRTDRSPEIVQVAAEHHIPVLTPTKLTDAVDQIKALGAEIGVLVAYGKLVPADIIAALPRGIVNIHPSLLPLHRGPTPIESVILSGETQTGVSLMQLGVELDNGAVYAQQRLDLQGDETKQALCDKLQDISTKMLLDNLPGILAGELNPTPQDESEAIYDKRIEKSASQLDFTRPAVQLEREIRAYAGWPRSRTNLNGVDIIVTVGHVTPGDGEIGQPIIEDKQLFIQTTEGRLAIDQLIPAGRKAMSAEAFLAGYKLD